MAFRWHRIQNGRRNQGTNQGMNSAGPWGLPWPRKTRKTEQRDPSDIKLQTLLNKWQSWDFNLYLWTLNPLHWEVTLLRGPKPKLSHVLTQRCWWECHTLGVSHSMTTTAPRGPENFIYQSPFNGPALQLEPLKSKNGHGELRSHFGCAFFYFTKKHGWL